MFHKLNVDLFYDLVSNIRKHKRSTPQGILRNGHAGDVKNKQNLFET